MEPKTKKRLRLIAAGSLGGIKGGPARRDSLTPERRIEIAKAAASARWNGHKKNPAT